MALPTLLERIFPARFSGDEWSKVLVAAILFGLGVGFYFAFEAGGLQSAIGILLVSAACLLVGVLLGFLFGIPRSLQNDPGADATGAAATKANRSRYQANTNLEQISDWLTKILVGVGLTELTQVPKHLGDFGEYFSVTIGYGADAARVAIAIVIFFPIVGFLLGYLWTRIFLSGELARADSELLTLEFEKIVRGQGEIDAAALSLASQHLTSGPAGKVSMDELSQAVIEASAPVKVQLFNQARALRSSSWSVADKRHLIERTIPIFEALIKADTDDRFHQNHAQLAYALKDKPEPDLTRALSEINIAIGLRGPAAEVGWQIYEFNRAQTRIRLDSDFLAGRPSAPEVKAQIVADLTIAQTDTRDFHGDPTIVSWLQLNELGTEFPALMQGPAQ